MPPSPSAEVSALLASAETNDGRQALSDQLAAALRDGSGTTIPVRAAGGLAGIAQLAPRPDGWTMQLVIDPDHREDAAIADNLVALALGTAAAGGGGRINWWVSAAGPGDDALAARSGFVPARDLDEMRRPLPAPWSATVATRPFAVGRDEEAWLEVNNRAFAGHPEQSAWTLAELRRRIAAPWFASAGFRLHEVDGRLAAFCWTKRHGPGDAPAAGEIYIIGVDPAFQGRGLGRQLTLAGLDAIVATGAPQALLYVDAANTAAAGLYRALGFEVTRTDRAYVLTVGGG